MKQQKMLWLIYTVGLTTRLILNFSFELIPGVNGGYYPLQVRYLLENSRLAFMDMPLLFYLNAAGIRLISMLGFCVTDMHIIYFVKITDSLLYPLIVFPFYQIAKTFAIYTHKIWFAALLLFVCVSFQPLLITSDLQKNALALVFTSYGLAYLIQFIYKPKRNILLFFLLFMVLTLLTHFGTFVFAIVFASSAWAYKYKQKAIIPVTALLAASFGLIAILNSQRLQKLLLLSQEIIEKPALLSAMFSPPELLVLLSAWFVAISSYFMLKKHRHKMSAFQKKILIPSLFCLMIFSFPLFDLEYFRRLSLFVFVLQAIILLILSGSLSTNIQKKISYLILGYTFISIILVFGRKKAPAIDMMAYYDLKHLSGQVHIDPKQSLVIARHGLEWWTAYTLRTKVAQDKAVDSLTLQTYPDIYILNQLQGFSPNHEETPFHEPLCPQKSSLVYSSAYFKLFLTDKQKPKMQESRRGISQQE